MLIFEGELSKATRKRINQKALCTTCLTWVISMPIAIVIILAMFFIYLSGDLYLFWVLVPPGCISMFVLLLVLFMRSKPNRIEIDGETIYVETKIEKTVCSLSKVKKVIDRGDVYEVIWHLPRWYPFCICQKDLLCQGTIEEFEDMFKDKIVQRIKTNSKEK